MVIRVSFKGLIFCCIQKAQRGSFNPLFKTKKDFHGFPYSVSDPDPNFWSDLDP